MNSHTDSRHEYSRNTVVAVVPALLTGPLTSIVLSGMASRILELIHEGNNLTLLYCGQVEAPVIDFFGHRIRVSGLIDEFLPASKGPMSPVMLPCRRVYETLRTLDAPSLILTTSSEGLLYYVLCAKKQRIAFSHTSCEIVFGESIETNLRAEGNFSNSVNTNLQSWVERKSLRLCNRVISPAPVTSRWLKSICPSEVEILETEHRIPTPLSLKNTNEITPDTSGELVFVGGISRRNGAVFLARTITQYSGCFTNLKLILHTLPGSEQGQLSNIHSSTRSASPAINVTEYPCSIPELLNYLLVRPNAIAITLPTSDCPNWFLPLARALCIPTITTDLPHIRKQFDGMSFNFTPLAPAEIAIAINEFSPPDKNAFDNNSVNPIRSLKPQKFPPTLPITRIPASQVTICISHYCRPELLSRALESLQRQSISGFEVIVVDDGSPDQYQAQLEKTIGAYCGQFDLQLIRKENQYLGATRNTGWRASNRNYILFMDDDNIANENEVELFTLAAANSDADILTCFSDTFYESNEPQLNPETLSRITPIGDCLSVGVNFNTFGDSNSFWKKSALEKIGGFTELKGVGKEDNEIFSRAILQGLNLMVVPEPLFLYQISVDRMRHHHPNPEAGTHHVLTTLANSCGEHVGDIANLLNGQTTHIQLLKKELLLARQCIKRTEARLEIVEKLIDPDYLPTPDR